MLWHSSGLRAPRRPVLDASLGGVRVYSDELVAVGAQVDIELMMPGQAPIALPARVVRVGIQPPSGPSFCDVSLQFVKMPEEARRRLNAALSSVSEPRVDEEDCQQVHHVEREHCDEGLLQASTRAAFASAPDGNGHVCEKNGDQNELLHCRSW